MFFKKKILNLVEQKKLNWLIWNPKALIKYNLIKAFNPFSQLNYLSNFYCNWWLINLTFTTTKLIGVGAPVYYSFGPIKWQKTNLWNQYQLKLNIWKDNWFLFGIVIKIKKKFLTTSLTIWNVFYNEIIEKTFFLFNVRNVLNQTISIPEVKQIFFKKKIWKKTKLYFIWSYPRSYSKVVLI